jgi:hypothetical protein
MFTPQFHQSNLQQQRGMSILSLMVWIVMLGSVFLIATKCVPPVFEYYEVKKALASAAKSDKNATAIRDSFDKSVQAGYIDSVGSKNLMIDNNGGEGQITSVSINYDKVVHIAGPVNVLFKFSAKEAVR